MLAPALRREAGVTEDEPIEARRERLRARFSAPLAERDRDGVVEFLGELCGVPFSEEGRVQLRAARRDRVLAADRIKGAWEAWLAAECGRRPVLLVLDDLQWGDVPTVELVDGALRAIAGPLLVLALGRDGVHQRFPRLWAGRDVVEMRLGRLSRPACERLVRALGGDIAEPEVERIVE